MSFSDTLSAFKNSIDFILRSPFWFIGCFQLLILFTSLIAVVLVELQSPQKDSSLRQFTKIETILFKRIVYILRWYNIPGLVAIFNTLLEIVLGKMLGSYKDRYYYSIINVMIPDFTFASDRYQYQFPSTSHEINCYFLMLCAKLSYECNDIIESIALDKWRQDSTAVLSTFAYKLHLDYIDRGTKIPPETFAFVRHDARSIVISFRGTEPLSLLDWATDFLAEPRDLIVNNRDVKIHTGFYEALTTRSSVSVDNIFRKDTIFDAIVKYIHNIPDREHKALFVSGHSLGGALATLFCYLLHYKHPELKVHTICTIGEPIVGNLSYAEDFNAIFKGKVYRYQYGADLVTTDPHHFSHDVNTIPQFMRNLVYHHHEGWNYISYDRSITTESTGALDKVRADRNKGCCVVRSEQRNPGGGETWLRTVSRYVLPLCLSDHFPDGYQVNLRAAAERVQTTGNVNWLQPNGVNQDNRMVHNSE